MDSIETKIFALPRSAYERYVAMRWLGRRWWLLAVPAAAAAVASAALADWRWLLVALMYIFVVSPGIVSMAYFKYLLTPEARLNAIPKQMVITLGQGITITYMDPEKTGLQLPRPEYIPWSDVRRTRLHGANYVIELASKPYPRFLIIPRKAVEGFLPCDM